ncbi:MAG: Flp family type IVb pilin [Pedobacter sp.]|nr:Flp family type IVb pilin [Pedobacter sp.]
MKLATLKDRIMTFVREEEGATAIEYALIAALIGLAIVGALTSTGGSLTDLFGRVQTALADTPTPPASN